jgi:hypothetical protein
MQEFRGSTTLGRFFISLLFTVLANTYNYGTIAYKTRVEGKSRDECVQ